MSQIWDLKSGLKKAVFHPAAKKAIQEFPKAVRSELGKAIFRLQRGTTIGMPLSRTMPSVGKGVAELRIKDESGEYRSFYICKVENAVIIFHAFVKKTQKTPPKEIDLGKKRLKEMVDES